jgi:uncharacterized C2H2 Zn-finger protein
VCTGTRTYQCDDCGALFNSRASLARHVSAQHGNNVFTCVYCGLTYKYQTGLIKHQKTSHEFA